MFVINCLLLIVCSYKGPDRHKLFGKILDDLHGKCIVEQRKFLEQRTGYGRALTGDGATILGTKFINFLVHEFGKGVMLCRVKDCTQRLQEVGAVQATFIAHEMINALRYVALVNYYLFSCCLIFQLIVLWLL